VLCHADIHPGNLMARVPDAVWVIDWDAPILAPRERDLMFVIGSDFGAQPANEELFRAGYGPTAIDRAVLAYYLHERICDDTVVNAEHILRADVSEAARVEDLYWTKAQFAPGSSLDRARDSAPGRVRR
jgi:spectinomycin phosphotransferase